MHYQLAIVGSGSGGREAALVAAKEGLKVLLIEKDTLGEPVCITVAIRSEHCVRVRKQQKIGSEAPNTAWKTAGRRWGLKNGLPSNVGLALD